MRKSVFILALVGATLFACKDNEEELIEPIVEAAALEVFQKGGTLQSFIDEGEKIPEELVDLGRMLFYEKRLSMGQDISCNSCHDLAHFGVDVEDGPVSVSDGHLGRKGTRNSPTVYNASIQFRQFWDGRAADVEEQAQKPITNPVEMAMTEERVLETLNSIPEYVQAFATLFPGAQPVSMANIGKAIGAFERRLITPTRFHEFLAGDTKVLTETEQRGLKTFLDVGCANCHWGPGLGGTEYRKLGDNTPWPGLTDKGEGELIPPGPDYSFKVSTLLNIAKTEPYGHNGLTKTLEEAVRNMALYQNGRTLTDAEVQSIVSFLNALTGEIPTEFIQEPPLPASTASTPEPDFSDD